VDGPPHGIYVPKVGFVKKTNQREPSMTEITRIGLDIAKNVFEVHGRECSGTGWCSGRSLRRKPTAGVVRQTAALP